MCNELQREVLGVIQRRVIQRSVGSVQSTLATLWL